jgi:hypothetical protein
MSQMPAALLGMLTVWAYLHWRHGRLPGWAALVGAFAGWAAITRPVDAIAYAAPVGLAMLLALLRGGERRAGARELSEAFGAIAAGAIPFLTLQAVFNRGVTGSALESPFVFYMERYEPGSAFGLGSRGIGMQPVGPATTLPQKLEFYRDFLVPGRGVAVGERLRITAAAAMPTPLLLPLVTIGLIGMASGRRWVLGAVASVFFFLYVLNPYYLPHYTLPIVPPLAMLVAAGGRALEEVVAPSSDGLRRFLTAWLAPAVVGICVSRLPELDAGVADDWIILPTVRWAHDAMPQAVQAPAVVLFRYRPGGNYHDEPVYNDDVAWPDDAPIIRAHDLGPRTRQIIEYYGRLQPGRQFYRYDRGSGTLTPLGTAAELVRTLPSTHPAPATQDVK